MTEPGWRGDPTGRFEMRWFDGRRWTKRVRVGEAEAIDTLSVPNDLQPPRERGTGREAGWFPDSDDPDQERFYDGREWTAATRDRRRRNDTPGVRSWPLPRIVVVALIVVGVIAALALAVALIL